MSRDRVLQKLQKKLITSDVQAVQRYLLLNTQLRLPNERSSRACTVVITPGESSSDDSGQLRKALKAQQERFLNATGFRDTAYEYCARCLTYLGDLSAKRRTPEAANVGWQKIREMGFIPRENCVSTYMYVLSLSSDALDATFDVASFHDRLFEPNEKTITLRIKGLVARGDPFGAERVLSSLPDKRPKATPDDEWKRLRTFQPILAHYCEKGNVSSILRLFRQMRHSNGVHLDSDTYSMILSSIATRGCFTTLGITDPMFDEGRILRGSQLLDEICSSMAEDLLDLTEESVSRIWKSLTDSFGQRSQHKDAINVPFIVPAVEKDVQRLKIGRVPVDDKTGVCRATGARLRLFALTADQRRHVHDTLLDMAAAQQREYGDKLKAQGKAIGDRNGTCARNELSKFSLWLQDREGEPYTAFVDGPNVGFYGHGSIHYSQVKAVVRELERRGERPLVIMPSKYIGKTFWLTGLGKFQSLDDKNIEAMNELLVSGKMYSVPAACLDDYYWMLASVANQTVSGMHVSTNDDQGRFPGLRPLLVTNDQMRDHRLSLLEPREFRRWTSCHIVKYDIAGYLRDEWEPREVTFFPADFFSREIQGNPHPSGVGSLVWHFPVAGWDEPDRFCVYINLL
jgi:pentatricopeptide repeat protein